MNMFQAYDEIPMSELNLLSSSAKVEVLPEHQGDHRWSATYSEPADGGLTIRVVGHGSTIEYALRDLYWKLYVDR